MRQRWLGHLARISHERLPKRVLSGEMDGYRVRGNSHNMGYDCVVGKLCTLLGSNAHVGDNCRTKKAGGLPQSSAAKYKIYRLGSVR